MSPSSEMYQCPTMEKLVSFLRRRRPKPDTAHGESYEMSTLEVPSAPVSLCRECLEAYGVLRNQMPAWNWVDRFLHPTDKSDVTTLPSDEWPTLPRLLASAQDGCVFCGFLRDAILSHRFSDAWEHLTHSKITNFDPTRLDLELWYRREHNPIPRHDPLHDPENEIHYLRCMTVRVTFEKGSSVDLHLELESMGDCRNVARGLVLRPPRIGNYENDMITSFLNEELHKYSLLASSSRGDPGFLPERLIDVGDDNLRLVEQRNISMGPTKPEYCALSYCWGPCEEADYQTKTTSRNIRKNLESLSFADLSPVVKDAVKAARSLSIPYLWVDSLCILQDKEDNSDWQRQCSQMHKIYGEARVTLITASSRTCREGFLNSQRHCLRFPDISARRHGISSSFKITFTHAFGSTEPPSDMTLVEDLYNDLNLSQWARRGWTFQEDVMSGARIVYGALGVYFGRNNKYTSKDGFSGFVNPKLLASSSSNKDLWHRAWENVIYRYSVFTTSSFTRPTDVLPALSGLARQFGEIFGVDYIAGHWVDRLHHSLMWAYGSGRARPSLNEISKREGQKPYIIPTWSCLARGAIKSVLPYNTKQTQSEITVLKAKASTVGDDPYGAIKDASVIIEGFVLKLASLSWFETSTELVGLFTDEEGLEAISVQNDPEYESLRFYAWKPPPVTLDKQHDYKLSLDFQVEPGHPLLGELRRSLDQVISRVTMLLLGSVEIGDSLDGTFRRTYGYGLLLVSMEGDSECSYLRVGTFYPRERALLKEASSIPWLKRLFKKDTIRIC